MKKIILFLFLALIFCGCTNGAEPRQNETSGEAQPQKFSIVCTIFPQYDWTRQIIGEENLHRFDLTLLMTGGADLHSFNPSVADIARVKTSDAFIYVGGHSDSWVSGVLRDANPIAVNMMDLLDFEHLLEGFCDDDCDEDHDHTPAADDFLADEHIWLSLPFAKTINAAIAEMLAEADPENALTYRANAAAYIEKLSALHEEFQAMANAASVRTLVFADRFPFRYLLNDYGLTYYAAFEGCSAETEVSFVTIISLATRLDRLGLNTVMVAEDSDQSIARTVIESTTAKNQRILVLDGMKSVTAADILNGATYLSIMENNLTVLREALN